jgi:hypothetical protein
MARLTDVNLLRKEPFPLPPVTNNLANIFVMKYYLKTWIDLFLNVQYFQEPEHYLNRLNEGSKLTINVGFRLLISGNIAFR